jgi:type IV secretory pathway VirJ component
VRERVGRIVLMSPSHRSHLKFRFIGWLGFPTPNHVGFPLLPDLEVLAATIPISCFAGEGEDDSLAHQLIGDVARIELLPGGHHYHGDYELLADWVLAHIKK